MPSSWPEAAHGIFTTGEWNDIFGMGERVQGIIDELRAESMRAATLVGLASVPVGFLWIYLLGTGSAAVVVLAGILVGLIYGDRPTPAYRAGARVGLFVPIPEALVQSAEFVFDVWTWPASLEAKVFFTVLVGFFIVLFLWVVGALFCIATAFVTEVIVNVLRERRSDATDQPR